MHWADIKKALSDYFTPAELIELLDIDTEELIEVLERETTVFSEDVVSDLLEIIEGKK